MFQALFFQSRDARGDLKAHKKEAQAPPAVSRSPKIGRRVSPQVNIEKHPTRANLVGGKGLFINMHQDKQWANMFESALERKMNLAEFRCFVSFIHEILFYTLGIYV